jgi:chemotaxis protein MotD
MSRTQAPQAGATMLARIVTAPRNTSEADAGFGGLLSDAPQIRSHRQLPAAHLERGLPPRRPHMELHQAFEFVEGTEKQPVTLLGAAMREVQSEGPENEAPSIIGPSLPTGSLDLKSALHSSAPGGRESLPAGARTLVSEVDMNGQPAARAHSPAPELPVSIPRGPLAEMQTARRAQPISSPQQVKTPEKIREAGSKSPVTDRASRDDRLQADENALSALAAQVQEPGLAYAGPADLMAAQAWQQTGVACEAVLASEEDCEIGTAGPESGHSLHSSPPGAPKVQVSPLRTTSAPGVDGLKSNEARQTAIASEHRFASPDAMPAVVVESGKWDIAGMASEGPSSAVSGAANPALEQGAAGPSIIAQSVLKQVEVAVKTNGVPALASSFAADARGIREGGQVTSLKFKLRPQELGEVTVTMRLRNERVFVEVHVETVQAYDALARNGDEMSARLAALGLQASQIIIQNTQTGVSSLDQNLHEGASSHRHDPGQRFDPQDSPKEQNQESHVERPDVEVDYGRSHMPGSLNSDGLNSRQKFLYI